MTLASNSGNFFLPNSVLNFRKVKKFWGNWLKNKKATGKKQIGGGKHPPPSAYRVKLNLEKSGACWIGFAKGRPDKPENCNWIDLVCDKIRILGVYNSYDTNLAQTDTISLI